MKEKNTPVIVISVLIIVSLILGVVYAFILNPYLEGEKSWWYMNIYGTEEDDEVNIKETDLVVSDTQIEKTDNGEYIIRFNFKNLSEHSIKILGICYDVFDKYGDLDWCSDFRFSKRIKSGDEIQIKGTIKFEEITEHTDKEISEHKVAISGVFADIDRDWKACQYFCDEDMMKKETVAFPN